MNLKSIDMFPSTDSAKSALDMFPLTDSTKDIRSILSSHVETVVLCHAMIIGSKELAKTDKNMKGVS